MCQQLTKKGEHVSKTCEEEHKDWKRREEVSLTMMPDAGRRRRMPWKGLHTRQKLIGIGRRPLSLLTRTVTSIQTGSNTVSNYSDRLNVYLYVWNNNIINRQGCNKGKGGSQIQSLPPLAHSFLRWALILIVNLVSVRQDPAQHSHFVRLLCPPFQTDGAENSFTQSCFLFHLSFCLRQERERWGTFSFTRFYLPFDFPLSPK